MPEIIQKTHVYCKPTIILVEKTVAKVFVSGCFDLLHSGHVAFFEEAAGHGDLYVGIGSDSTIAALKGRSPVNTEEERLYMVKALRTVKDAWINAGSGFLDFIEDIKTLRPDIFFVNTDGYNRATSSSKCWRLSGCRRNSSCPSFS